MAMSVDLEILSVSLLSENHLAALSKSCSSLDLASAVVGALLYKVVSSAER